MLPPSAPRFENGKANMILTPPLIQMRKREECAFLEQRKARLTHSPPAIFLVFHQFSKVDREFNSMNI
jgi:hypothetical protein